MRICPLRTIRSLSLLYALLPAGCRFGAGAGHSFYGAPYEPRGQPARTAHSRPSKPSGHGGEVSQAFSGIARQELGYWPRRTPESWDDSGGPVKQ